MRELCVATVVTASVLLAAGSDAQQATVTVSHNDPDGIVLPGQTVEITTTIGWSGSNVYALGLLQGGVRSTPDVGTATSPRFPTPYITNPWQVLNPGVPAVGSIGDIVIYPAVIYWTTFAMPIGTPWFWNTGVELHRFNWTAPTQLGVVSFEFEGDPMYPAPLFAAFGSNPPGIAVPTTYLGTSLAVVPAPASAAVLSVAGAALGRRRRGW